MEEERRLAYVAITRAEKELYLTCASSRMLFGRTSFNMPSRFISEIDAKRTEMLHQENVVVQSNVPFASRKPVQRTTIRKPVYEKSGSEKLAWQAGDRASHKKWGVGTVVSVRGTGDDMELDIAFPQPTGIKRLLAKFAPIEKEL